jgi:predicted aconitase
LSANDEAMLAGRGGEAAALVMRVVVAMARALRRIGTVRHHRRAHRRLPVPWLRRPGLRRLLVRGGARVRVPTTLNLSSLDLLHRDRYRGDAHTAAAARRLMDSYVAMGARATWTCAPYQLPTRPGLGEHRQSDTCGQTADGRNR